LDDLQDKLQQATHTQHEVETALSERIQRLSALETEMEAKASLERELSELKAQYDDQVSRAQQMLQDIEANDDHLMTYDGRSLRRMLNADFFPQVEEGARCARTEGYVACPQE
jgi:hypothetical protein